MKITKEHIGKKIKHSTWDDNEWIEVVYVGREKFFAIDEVGHEESWFFDDDWVFYEEPKKKKLMSPVIHYYDDKSAYLTTKLFASEDEVRKGYQDCKGHIIWPAMIVIDGKSVPLQFEVEE